MEHDRANNEVDSRRREQPSRRPAFVAWLSVAAAVACVCVAALFPAFQRMGERSRIKASAQNLKQLAIVLMVYEGPRVRKGVAAGRFLPPMAPVKGLWVPDIARLSDPYVEQLQLEGSYDPTMWVNPRLADAKELMEEMRNLLTQTPVKWERVYGIIAEGYAYTNWYIPDEAAFDEVRELYTLMTPADYDNDIETEARKYYRLQWNIGRYLLDPVHPLGIVDPHNPLTHDHGPVPSYIPTIFETTPGKLGGINVLYMDGHVKFMKIGSGFPATERIMDVFSAEVWK